MSNEQVPKATETTWYDRSEDGLWGMMRDFYNKQMLCTIAFVLFWALVFLAGAVYCGVRFFQVDETHLQIAYAGGFICLIHGNGMMKIFAWQLIHRNNIRRAIKRLETRVTECIRACQTRP